jgi:hypothetical protein
MINTYKKTFLHHWFTGTWLVFNFPASSYDSAHFSFEKSKTKSSVFVSEILQNVTTGKHRQCGDSDSPILIEQFTDAHSGLGGVQGESSHTVDLRIELQVSKQLRRGHSGLGGVQGESSHTVDLRIELQMSKQLRRGHSGSGECRGRAVTLSTSG